MGRPSNRCSGGDGSGCIRLGPVPHTICVHQQRSKGPPSQWPFRKLLPEAVLWEAITRFRDSVAQVNLLLNRASAWLDIDSYLPYAGKVVLKNKTCRGIHVRIPKWVDRRATACRAARAKLPFSWAGDFLILSGLTGKEVITIEFPLVETVETYYLLTPELGSKWWEQTDDLPTYILQMKGSTCAKVEFPNRTKFTQLEPMYPRLPAGALQGEQGPDEDRDPLRSPQSC
jgi:hypothetical protein